MVVTIVLSLVVYLTVESPLAYLSKLHLSQVFGWLHVRIEPQESKLPVSGIVVPPKVVGGNKSHFYSDTNFPSANLDKLKHVLDFSRANPSFTNASISNGISRDTNHGQIGKHHLTHDGVSGEADNETETKDLQISYL